MAYYSIDAFSPLMQTHEKQMYKTPTDESACIQALKRAQETISRLQRENEQLRSENKSLKDALNAAPTHLSPQIQLDHMIDYKNALTPVMPFGSHSMDSQSFSSHDSALSKSNNEICVSLGKSLIHFFIDRALILQFLSSALEHLAHMAVYDTHIRQSSSTVMPYRSSGLTQGSLHTRQRHRSKKPDIYVQNRKTAELRDVLESVELELQDMHLSMDNIIRFVKFETEGAMQMSRSLLRYSSLESLSGLHKLANEVTNMRCGHTKPLKSMYSFSPDTHTHTHTLGVQKSTYSPQWEHLSQSFLQLLQSMENKTNQAHKLKKSALTNI